MRKKEKAPRSENQSGPMRKRQAVCPTSEAPVKFRFRGRSKAVFAQPRPPCFLRTFSSSCVYDASFTWSCTPLLAEDTGPDAAAVPHLGSKVWPQVCGCVVKEYYKSCVCVCVCYFIKARSLIFHCSFTV